MRLVGSDYLFSRLFERISKSEEATGDTAPIRTSTSISLDIPEIEPINRDKLYAAAKQFVEATKIGEFVSYKRPFTKQIRGDFRALYHVLTPFFKHTEIARQNVRNAAIRMRCMTLLLFALYAAAVYFALTYSSGSVSPDLELILPQNILLAMPLVFPILAGLVRGAGISKIKELASEFGSDFNRNLNLIYSKATYALDNVSEDAPATDGCDERAEKWTAIALWLFELQRLYDRYVTTASWRVQTAFLDLTWAFRSIKWVILGVLIYNLSPHFSKILASSHEVSLAMVIYVLFSFIWDVIPGRGAPNTLFEDSFIRSVAGRSTTEEVFRNHMNTKISRLVKKLRDLYYNALKD